MKDTISSKSSPARPIERIVTTIISQLPLLDARLVEEAMTEARERPRATTQYLMDRLSSKDAAMRAIAEYVLERVEGSEIADDLNAIVFDGSQDSYVRVLANDLLRRFGNPIDPEVFEMTVPDAGPEIEKLPSRVMELANKGSVKEAAALARRLSAPERWMAMVSAAEKAKAHAVPLLEDLAKDNEENAKAAASAIAMNQIQEGVPLLLKLQIDAGKDFQRVLRRMLYDFKEAGVEVPEEKSEEAEATAAKPSEDDGMPLFRAMMSEASPQGMVLVTVARRRPNGRLKVFSVVVDPWKRGIAQAGLRLDMSRSAFDRFVEGQAGSKVKLRETSIDDCRKAIARGIRVAQEFGFALPYDFGIGRSMVGNIDEAIAEIKNPFLCSLCGGELDNETIERVRAASPYEHMPVETKCAKCREKA